jgi:hypothetical protein
MAVRDEESVEEAPDPGRMRMSVAAMRMVVMIMIAMRVVVIVNLVRVWRAHAVGSPST